MRSELREAMEAQDHAEAVAGREKALGEQAADEAEAKRDREGGRAAGTVGVFLFTLAVLFGLLAVAAAMATGKVDGITYVTLITLPVNSMALGGAWRLMTRTGDE